MSDPQTIKDEVYPEFKALKQGVVTGLAVFSLAKLYFKYSSHVSIGASLAAFYLSTQKGKIITIRKAMKALNPGNEEVTGTTAFKGPYL